MSTAAEQFSTHAEPIWRDRANFIINAPLPEPGRFEQLWTRKVSESEFEICCIPFFLYDLALGDIVETAPQEGRQYVLSRVVKRSGRYVFRAFQVRVAQFPRACTLIVQHLAGMALNKGLLDNNEWAPTVRAIEDLFNAITGPPPRRYR